MYKGRDMHIMSALNLRINGKHVQRSSNLLARSASMPATRGGPEPLMGLSQLRKGCSSLAILHLPGQPPQSARFLMTFSSALIGGSRVANQSHQELTKGAVYVIGMPCL